MDWPAYKACCDRPDYWSRWMLLQCRELIAPLADPALIAMLDDALGSAPLERPVGFKGPQDLHMHRLVMPHAARAQVLELMQRMVAQGVTTPATRTRGLGGFVEAWREYTEFDSP